MEMTAQNMREIVMSDDLVQCDFCGEWYENESEGESNE